MRLLALDFDGVLCDSAHEIFPVALRTYAALRPSSRLAADHGDSVASVTAATLDDALYRSFCNLLPLGNRAEDFGVALDALDEGRDLPDQEAYDAYRASRDPEWLAAFHRRFYEQRSVLRDGDRRAWLALHAPYPGFRSVLGTAARRSLLAIASAKDETSVRVLLSSFGLDPLFPPGSVLDKEAGVEKTDHLAALSERLGIPFQEITFIDDKINHLLKVRSLGVTPVLAGWGFNTPREHRLARQAGVPVATLDTIGSLLAGAMPP
jgi:phosphoglycolate phosphatase-like HAD superfamily hydrolase